MKVLIIDNHTKYLGKLRDLLVNYEIEITDFERINSDDSHDLAILTGGSFLSIENAPEIFKDEINFIRNTTKPIIGICQGAQLIAYSYGSILEFIKRRTKGIKEIELINNTNLDIDTKYFYVYESHQWAIKNLGKDLEGLAKSKNGFEIVKHKSKKIYGLQFHPEMAINKSLGDEIFNLCIRNVLSNHLN